MISSTKKKQHSMIKRRKKQQQLTWWIEARIFGYDMMGIWFTCTLLIVTKRFLSQSKLALLIHEAEFTKVSYSNTFPCSTRCFHEVTIITNALTFGKISRITSREFRAFGCIVTNVTCPWNDKKKAQIVQNWEEERIRRNKWINQTNFMLRYLTQNIKKK